jgi:hypothetical protein
MFESLRLRTGLAYSKFHFRKQKERATRFSSAISRSRQALVILPERPLEEGLLTDVVDYISRRFTDNTTIFIVRDDLRKTLPAAFAKHVHTYSREDLTSFFTPRSALIRKFKSSTFDIAFDLNREFFLPSAFMCKASSAPIRVGFVKPHADAFYNLQVQTHGPANQSAYTKLFRCLDMF